MSFAYLPFYTGDYFRDTRGLSMAGHGCYLLLLTYCWDSQGPLPIDEERIAGICEARNQEERTTLQKILRTYFTRMDDGWYNRRMQREIERSHAIGLMRKVAGAKGYQAKAKHLPSKSLASAKHVPLPPSPSLTSELELEVQDRLVVANDEKQPQPARRRARNAATRLQNGWELPDDWLAWAVALRTDWNEERAMRESLVFRDHWLSAPGQKGTKADWEATWRNWVRRAT